VVFVAVVFSAAVDDIAVDSEIIAVAVVVVGFVDVAGDVADKFCPSAEVLALHANGRVTDNSTPPD